MDNKNYQVSSEEQVSATTKTALEELCQEERSLIEKMKREIVRIVRENGSLIRSEDKYEYHILRTDNTDTDNPYINAFVIFNMSGLFEECKILALKTYDDALYILIGEIYETLGDISDEDILERSGWYSINDYYVFKTATLHSIYVTLDEYLR